MLRRRSDKECGCKDIEVLKTVTDVMNPNYGKQFWGCRNYRSKLDPGCNHFRWLDDDIVDERNMLIEKLKKKNLKMKLALAGTTKQLKMSNVFGLMSLGVNIVLVTMFMCNKSAFLSQLYLK